MTPYNYAYNDPVYWNDPLGDCPRCYERWRAEYRDRTGGRNFRGQYIEPPVVNYLTPGLAGGYLIQGYGSAPGVGFIPWGPSQHLGSMYADKDAVEKGEISPSQYANKWQANGTIQQVDYYTNGIQDDDHFISTSFIVTMGVLGEVIQGGTEEAARRGFFSRFLSGGWSPLVFLSLSGDSPTGSARIDQEKWEYERLEKSNYNSLSGWEKKRLEELRQRYSFDANGNVIERIRLKYNPTKKHGPGGWGTLMDLDYNTAYNVLLNSVPGGKQRYGYHDGKLYEFQPDNVDGWHGYPVKGTEVPPSVLRYFRDNGIITSPQYNKMIKGK